MTMSKNRNSAAELARDRGPSKGCVFNQVRTLLWGMSHAEAHGYRPSDVFYSCMPLFHVSALREADGLEEPRHILRWPHVAQGLQPVARLRSIEDVRILSGHFSEIGARRPSITRLLRKPSQKIQRRSRLVRRRVRTQMILQHAGRIRLATQHILSIVDDVLDLARVEAPVRYGTPA